MEAGLRRKVKERNSQASKQVQIEPILLEKQKSEISAQPQASVDSTSQTEHIPLTPIASKQLLKPRQFTREVLPYTDPLMKLPFRLSDLRESQKILMNTDMNTDFEENSPYQEGIISETYERLEQVLY